MNEVTTNLEPTDGQAIPMKIGGGLILVAIGVTTSPIYLAYSLLETYPSFFTDGTWKALISKTSAAYSPSLAAYILTELVINIVILIGSIYLIVLFLKKKSEFPKWYAGIAFFSLSFVSVTLIFFALNFPDAVLFDEETVKAIGKSAFACFVWTPYLFLSKRSKETFVC